MDDTLSLIKSYMLEEVFELLKQNNFNFRLMTTITSNNYMILEEMCDKSIELGAKGLFLTNYILQGNAINHEKDGLVLNAEQINAFFEQLTK